MARAAAFVNIAAVGAIIVAAIAATKVVDRLAGKGFRRETCPGDDSLAVFILISGVGGLETRHYL